MELHNRRPCILAVDDDPGMLKILQKVLARDYDLTLARDGEEGLQSALAHPPDLILTDVRMPGMNGTEMVRQLHAHPSVADVPVIILTGREDDEVRLELLRAGAQEFLVKPCSAEELLARLRNVLTLKLARDLLQEELKVRSTDIQALIREVAARRSALESALAISQFARDHAERASQAKSAFLSLVSHELKTPLTVLRLLVDGRRRKAGATATGPDAELARTDEALARLETLVESVVQLVKLQGEQSKPQVEQIDIEPLIRDVVLQFESRIRDKHLSLKVEVAPDARTVCSDPRMLRLILSNLVSNAIKFTHAGLIEIRSCVRDGTVLAVRDSGPGIDTADRERIFQPFTHVETINHKSTPGMGLGLALVRELVTALGASLAIDSKMGGGSTFSVIIPTPPPARPLGP